MVRWGILALGLFACGNDGGSTVDHDAASTSDSGSGTPSDATLIDGAVVDGGAAVDAPTITGEPPELQGITAAHNQVRAAVQTQTPLPALTWSNELAATAAAWVATCTNVDQFPNIHDHNPNRSQGHPYYVGENIYASSGTATAQGAVQNWASEGSAYVHPDASRCNGNCGHYTQIVWRTTLEVGCARGNCPSIPYGSTIVCNYGPGGNTGGVPY